MQMTECTIVLTDEQFEALEALDLYEIDRSADGTLNIQCYDDDDCVDVDFIQALSDMGVTGQIKFYQGISGWGRTDSHEFGYDFENGILSELEAVVTWRKVTPPQ